MFLGIVCKWFICTVLLGFAVGVIVSIYIVESVGFLNVIICDMGGISFDVFLVVGG